MKVNLTDDQLKHLCEELDSGMICYIHKATNEVTALVNFDDPYFDEELMELWEESYAPIRDNPDDYYRLQGMESGESYTIMEDFIRQLDNGPLKENLHQAINRRKPFRQFRNIVDHHMRDEWFAFKENAYKEWVIKELRLLTDDFDDEDEDYKEEEFVESNEPEALVNEEKVIFTHFFKAYNDVTRLLLQLLSPFIIKNKLGYLSFGKLVLSMPKADICFFNNEKSKHFQKGQSAFPAPNLAIEIFLEGTPKRQRKSKFEAYQAYGVLEYWLIDPKKEKIKQYRLESDGVYNMILDTNTGPISCKAINGFEIEIEAIFNERKNLEELQRLLKN